MTYNKFHLLTDEKTFNKNTNKLLNHKIYEYYDDPERKFEQQVPQFLSLKTEKTRNYNASGQYKELVHITHYDEFNNLIFEQDPYGIETHNQYYTADELNTSDPLYIPHLIKCSEIHPSKKYALGTENVAKTEYEYQNFKALTGNRTFYLPTKELQHHGNEFKFELNIEYHLNPNFIISYGLESHRKSYNTALNSELTHYIDHGDRIELIKSREYFDGLTKVEKNIFNPLTQEKIEETDHLGNQTKFTFDGHGRLTKEIFKPGTDYEFITEYRYLNNDCKNEVIKNGLLFQVIEFDALGRKIKTYKIDSQGKIKSDQAFSYDSYDRNILTVTFDESDGTFQQSSLITEYPDWWTKKEIDENSVFNLTENDPVNLTETVSLYSDNHRISKTVNVVNELGENIKTVKDSKIEKFSYDGFNQLVKKEDAQGLITEWKLDALGREINE